MRLLFAALAFALAATGCGAVKTRPVAVPAEIARPTAVDHGAFSRVLAAYVDSSGLVDYAGLKKSGALKPYVEMLAGTDPSALAEKDEIAFWINAYNANTLKLILDNYPTASIKKLVPFAPFGLKIFVPAANSPFSQPFARVGGRSMSLDDIEHGQLRKRFKEPRIHFALVCAAVSCPPLRQEAYVGSRLDAQLDSQARRFLHDPSKNQIPAAPGEARLSKILDWYGGDFGDGDAALQAALAPYFEGDRRAALERGAYRLSFLPYDWSLNGQR